MLRELKLLHLTALHPASKLLHGEHAISQAVNSAAAELPSDEVVRIDRKAIFSAARPLIQLSPGLHMLRVLPVGMHKNMYTYIHTVHTYMHR